MDNQKKTNWSNVAFLLAAIGFAAPALSATQFTPRLGVSAIWTDNYLLAPPGEPEVEELIAQVVPGFSFVHDSNRSKAYVSYELQALYSDSRSSETEYFHKGDLGLALTPVPDWFYLDFAAGLQQNVIDPTQARNIDNLFLIGNTADSSAARITPRLSHSYRAVRFDAAYTYGIVDYEGLDFVDASLADSTNHEGRVAIGSASTDAALTWDARYHYQRAEYDAADSFENERVDLELGVRVTPALRLLATAGLESDPTAFRSDRGLDETIWQAGFAYARNDQNALRLLVGERYFGTSYELLWEHVGRVVGWTLSYNEDPTTEGQEIIVRSTPTADDAELPPDRALDRPGSDVYLLKRMTGELSLTGRLTKISLVISSDRREYVNLQNLEDEARGATVALERQLGPRMRTELTASVQKYDLREGTQFDEAGYSLLLSRDLGNRTTAILTLNRNERTGWTASEYEVNWVVLGIQATF